MIEYDPFSLLTEFDKFTIRETHVDKYFYHGTGRQRFDSIKKRGLDLAFREGRSIPAGGEQDPLSNKLCTNRRRGIAINAGERDLPPLWERGPGDKIIVLRTKATLLLNKRFGLRDRSFPDLWLAVERTLQKTSKQHLTADEFLSLLDEFGVICCYDSIPPQELEISEDINSFLSTGGGAFAPLLKM